MKSKINKFNPGDYERNMDVIPKKWIDHFNTTPRIIRCISDGKEEMEFFEKNDFLFGPVYWISEDDDFTYYLRAIVRDKLLEAGKEYRLVGNSAWSHWRVSRRIRQSGKVFTAFLLFFLKSCSR